MTAGAAPNDVQSHAARAQSMFREVNERIGSLQAHARPQPGVEEFVCECADTACTGRIALPRSEYDELRTHPSRFAVLPSEEHVAPDVEHVVARHEGYWVVEKVELSGEVAELLDPRSRS